MIPTDDNLKSRLKMMNELKTFLVTAPDQQLPDTVIQPFTLPSNETISCVQWNDSFFITGTDIVRCLVFRFQAFGRPIDNIKKFEEGIFSDLRNLKPGTDAILEEPKSAFLEILFKNNCIRTQKKQKVFYWYSVPHDRLFLDALERDLKREKLCVEPTSKAVALPATSISLQATQAMYDEFRKAMLYELNLVSDPPAAMDTSAFGQFSLFEGSPTYKQRKRRVTQQQTENKKYKVKHYDPIQKDSRHFECPLSSCRKVFKRLEHMKRHLRTHTMERPYLCDLCGKRFSRSDNLSQHKKTHLRKEEEEEYEEEEDEIKEEEDDQQSNTKLYIDVVTLPALVSNNSSCHSSPTPMIDLYYDEMVEDLLPSPQQESNDDWQSKIDWNQYQYPPDLMMTPVHTNTNSPILEEEEYLSHYCDEILTMSPIDALLQH